MKEIQIQVQINDLNQMANAIKTINLDKESLDGILIIIGILDNLKQQQLNKLESLRKI
jgi:hypothetical protein